VWYIEESPFESFAGTLRDFVSASPRKPAEIARDLGCSASELYRWQAGTDLPDYSMIEKMFEVLELDWMEQSYLYGAWQIYFEQLAAKRDGVFVSYRHSDDRSFAGRLHDRLIETFGPERVFMEGYSAKV